MMTGPVEVFHYELAQLKKGTWMETIVLPWKGSERYIWENFSLIVATSSRVVAFTTYKIVSLWIKHLTQPHILYCFVASKSISTL